MLNVDDILTELDILAVDSTVLTTFGPDAATVSANLADKRRVAVQDWLHNAVLKRGYAPTRHKVRRVPDKAWSYTGAAYTDRTSTLSDTTVDDLDLSAVFAAPGSDALYVGLDQPFRSLFGVMLDAANVNTLSINSPTYWNGGKWASFNSLVDATMLVNSLAWSGGGRLSWQLPTDWQPRLLNESASAATWRYWVRLQVNRTPSANTKVSYLLPVVRSRLTTPAVYHALALLYMESWGVQPGEWRDKARGYAEMAGGLLAAALTDLDDEFTVDDPVAIKPGDINSVVTDTDHFFSWERG